MLEVTELESSDKLYKTRVQVRNGDQLEERQVGVFSGSACSNDVPNEQPIILSRNRFNSHATCATLLYGCWDSVPRDVILLPSRMGLMQILAGLRKHVARSELEGSLVVVILNLKTAKLAGAPSPAESPRHCAAHESVLA